ncbi:hypothetical protein [uncultured Chryseobacterium sp.]|uniref:hypothetical protein n=1 Tax=uncultured Chryseobacterium sp. TaxID=259322 RepID=UPI0025F097AA|nr:hypothetical protein [uncultured Chryseobacterium sp.]
MNEKLAKFSVEKLEERKEFIFYCCPKPYYPPTPAPTPVPTPTPNPGNQGGV